MKYKVGQRIKVIDNHNARYKRGYIGIITDAHTYQADNHCYVLDDMRGNFNTKVWIAERRLELISLDCTCGVSVCNNCKLYRGN